MPRPAPAPDQLGTRPLGRLLWHSCSQTTLSVGVYGIYALTNAWFVARGVGPTAMAAVNLVAPILLGLGAISTTVGVGGASLVSRSLGSGDPVRAARAAGSAFVVFLAAATLTTVVGLTFLEPLLTALGARGATLEYARDYAVIILAGSILSTGFSSLVRAEGRMLFSTMLWLIPVVVTMALDPLLIFGLDLGVRGAAIGTVAGQAVSAAMSFWFFFLQKNRPYRIGWRGLRPHWPTIAAVLGIGAPSFLAGAGTTLLTVLVNLSLTRADAVTAGAVAGGTVALAAYAICARIQTFVVMPQTGISQGLQPIVGYNAGAGLITRVSRARTLALRATILYSLTAAGVVALAAEPLARVFVDEPEVVATTTDAMRIIAVGVVLSGVTPLVSAYFQALGQPRPSYLISIGTLLVIKIPLVLALGTLGPTGTWIALAAGEVLAAIVSLCVLRSVARRAASPSAANPTTATASI